MSGGPVSRELAVGFVLFFVVAFFVPGPGMIHRSLRFFRYFFFAYIGNGNGNETKRHDTTRNGTTRNETKQNHQANARDSQYDATLLHWAVNEGHMPTVEHLLACGADVRLRDGKQ